VLASLQNRDRLRWRELRRRVAVAAMLVLAAGLAACPPADDPTDDLGVAVTALFELPRAEPFPEFYALPFPNDLRLRADGTVDLDQHARQSPFISGLIDVFGRKTHGFGTNAAIYVRFSGEIDPATLPAGAAASRDLVASVYLVDVDARSPERGHRTPLLFRFQAQPAQTIGPNWLGCLPYPGFPLRPATTYALVVTDRLRAAGGGRVGRSADLEAIFSGSGGDAAVARAREVYAPLLAWLDDPESPDDREDVVSATVFTTQDPTSLMGRAREVVRALPEPEASGLTPTFTTALYRAYQGTYSSPNFQTGEPPYTTGGEIVVDESGAPIVQRMETLRFAVSVPRTLPPPAGGWPIVLYAHGTGGDYQSFLADGTATRMAAEGLATISIDQVLHGPRDPSGTPPGYSFFNFQNPIAGRDNVRQAGIDNFQLVRLASRLVIEDGATLHRFDERKITFMGHSQGGLTGPPFLAYEPAVGATVLSGAGGLIYIALLYKTQPDDVDIPGLVQAFLRDHPLSEHNNVLALMQMFLEPADPMNYAPLLLRAPVPGVGAKHVYQSEGLVDNYAPIAGIEALGIAIGLSPVAPLLQPVEGFGLRGLAPLAAPVSSNTGDRTGVFVQYAASAGRDGHFVIFNDETAQRQHARFLGSLAQTGTATLVP
jgi:predicted esterase